MSVTTLLRFLIGDRAAILALSRMRGGLFIGALFVLGAALARTYDTEPLRSEAWRLALPFGVSLAAATILFAISHGLSAMRGAAPAGPLESYTAFLTLFWMTAPLAGLYGIPYERFLGSADAVTANLWTLGLVSLWRVVLITRIISVLFNVQARAAFGIVMLFADIAALIALHSVKLPIINFMGGVLLTAAESAIASTAMLVVFFGYVSLPVWLGWFLWGVTRWYPSAEHGEGQDESQRLAAGPLLPVASMAIVAFIAPMYWTQREQLNRARVEAFVAAGQYGDAIVFMSAREPGDFPPHWDPPPRPGYGEREPEPLALLESVVERESPEWVRRIYIRKFLDAHLSWRWQPFEGDPLRLDKILASMPEGAEIAGALRESLQALHESQNEQTPVEQREATLRLLDLAGVTRDETGGQ